MDIFTRHNARFIGAVLVVLSCYSGFASMAHAQSTTCTLPTGTWNGRSTASGQLVKVVNFETGNLSQCSDFTHKLGGLLPPTDQIFVDRSPTNFVRQGLYSAKFVVRPGEFDAPGTRASIHLECFASHINRNGDDTYYALSMYVPSSIIAGSGIHHIVALQAHGPASYGVNPMLSLNITGDGRSAILNSKGGELSCPDGIEEHKVYEDAREVTFPITPDSWNDFVLHVMWDHRTVSGGGTGRVEVWHRSPGQTAFTKVVDMNKATLMYGQKCDGTMVPSETSISQTRFGTYVSPGQTTPLYLIHDGFRIGTTLSSVVHELGCSPTGTPAPGTSTLPVIPPPTPTTCTNTLTSSTAIPTGYGASYNPLTSAREYLVQASCTTSTNATVTVGNGNSTTYVYNRGYYWTGSAWTSYTLSCGAGALISGAWCPGRATASIPLPQNPQNVIAYTCQYTNSTWKCGCRDATCSTPYWQLQRLQR